ncbi:MAG: hypothetical protein WCO10_03700 [bacterium]
MITDLAKNNKTGGFVVLATVLMVSAVVVMIGSGVLLRSISSSNNSLAEEQSVHSTVSANSCAEYAMLQLSTTTGGLPGWSYVGGQSLSLGSDTCSYSVVNADSAKSVKASSTVSGFVHKIQVVVATSTPTMSISSWKDVADFY